MSSPLCYKITCGNCGHINNIDMFDIPMYEYNDLDGKPNGYRYYEIPNHCTHCNYVSENLNKITPEEKQYVDSLDYQTIFNHINKDTCPTYIKFIGRAYLNDALNLHIENSRHLIYACWEKEIINDDLLCIEYRIKALESVRQLFELNKYLDNDIKLSYIKFQIDSYRRLGNFNLATLLCTSYKHLSEITKKHLNFILFQEFLIQKNNTKCFRESVLITDWSNNKLFT